MNKFKRNGLFGRLSALAMSAAMLATLPSCGPADQADIERTGKVMVIVKSDPSVESFWQDVINGAKDAGEEMGYEVAIRCPDDATDIDSQKGFINEAIREKYNVIVLAPNSKDGLSDELQDAVDNNIQIININSESEFDDIKCLIATSGGASASTCCDHVAKVMRERNGGKLAGVGKIAIIPDSADTADSRVMVFKNRLGNEIMIDMQSSGGSISGDSYSGDGGSDDGVVAVLEDGTELLRPEEAANRAAAAAAKSGLKGDDVVNAATQAAQEAAAKLKAAGYSTDGGQDGSEDGEEGGEQGGGTDANGVEDPAANMMTPDEAAQAAIEEAKKDSSISPQQYSEIANAAAQEQVQAIAKAREEAGYVADGQGGGSQGGQTTEDGVPVDKNGVKDPAYGMTTPSEAAQEAINQARKAGASTDAIAAAGEKASQEAAAAIARAREKAGYIVPDEQKQQESSSGSSGGRNYFKELQDEYFIEAEPSVTSFQAFEKTLALLDPDGDNVADDTGIKVIYATNSFTTIGACQAVEQLDLAGDIIVVGYNSDEKILSYLNTGTLSATVVSNPYNMGYLGVIYAKKLFDGSTITRTINTGVTLVTSDNITSNYIQAILFPGQSIDISDAPKTTTAKPESAAEENNETEANADEAEKNDENGGNE